MRSKFFLYLGLTLIALIVGYFVWMVVKAFYTIFSDYRSGVELDRLGQQLADKRQERRRMEERRLANGCDHEFDDLGGALPPDVCCKCGIAKVAPEGNCDHVWRFVKGIIPESTCEKCGKRYSGVTAVHVDFPD